MPIEPVSMELSSDRMSPNMWPLTSMTKTLGLFHRWHRGGVHAHVVQCDVRVVFSDFADHVFPELEDLQPIGFVHAGHAALRACGLALAHGLESHTGDALVLRLVVVQGIEGFFSTREVSVGSDAAAAWLAQRDVTRAITDDQTVEVRNLRWLQARCRDPMRVANGRAEVVELGADAITGKDCDFHEDAPCADESCACLHAILFSRHRHRSLS
jgi:hypothetical protein